MLSDALLRAVFVGYLGVLSLLCLYGLHRLALVYLFYRYRRGVAAALSPCGDWPTVTVQLPMFNEPAVAERVIRAACQLDYPAGALEIQVLDDSTEPTRGRVAALVAELQAGGAPLVLLQRAQRLGYKAGALEAGLHVARGELLAVFDADFVPPPDLLRRVVPRFADPAIGMVQCRWEHLNRDTSLLTQAQAVWLDSHFVIEHTARARSGRYINFNGTAGVWRKAAIVTAGGWEHDTLTEDLDLSFRAQLGGWKFDFLPGVAAPAELPPAMDAFKAQQHRWIKGGAQTCRKLLARVLREARGGHVKLEAFFHLTSWVVYVLMVLLSVLIGPAIYAQARGLDTGGMGLRLLELALLLIGTFSAVTFYGCGQRALGRSWYQSVRDLPGLLAIGVGIALNNAWAALAGLSGRQSPFVRTPKFGAGGSRLASRLRPRVLAQAALEVLLAGYLFGWLLAVVAMPGGLANAYGSVPFLVLFVVGYAYVGLATLTPLWQQRPTPAKAA